MEITQGVRFDSLKLSPEILRALLERNIVQSTPVQAGCIPPMLESNPELKEEDARSMMQQWFPVLKRWKNN